VLPVVYLVGCGKSKLTRTAKAKDLYTGNLFRAARRYVESTGADWRILSAKYRTLAPEQRIAPYNERLSTREGDRAIWGKTAATMLTSSGVGGGDGTRYGNHLRVICLAGEDYAGPVCGELESRGIECTRPLEGLGVGQRLKWFKEHTPADAPALPPVLVKRSKPTSSRGTTKAKAASVERETITRNKATPKGAASVERETITRNKPEHPAASELGQRIERIGFELGGNQWQQRVRLSLLRAKLGDVPRATLDRTLLEMQRADRLVLYRLDNPREVNRADEAAALDIAGHPRHLAYFIGPSALEHK
jgi:hypothetical protein